MKYIVHSILALCILAACSQQPPSSTEAENTAIVSLQQNIEASGNVMLGLDNEQPQSINSTETHPNPFIDWDRIAWEQMFLSPYGFTSPPPLGHEELSALSKNQENQNYSYVVQQFVLNNMGKQVKSTQSLRQAEYRVTNKVKPVLVQTTDDTFFIMELKRWEQYGGIWTVVHYPYFSGSPHRIPSRYETILGIPSIRVFNDSELDYSTIPNFSMIQLDEAPDEVRQWGRQITQYSDSRMEYYLDDTGTETNTTSKPTNVYIIIMEPHAAQRSIVVDFVYVSGEVQVYYKLEDNFERLKNNYVLLKIEHLYTHEVSGFRYTQAPIYPRCNGLTDEKVCPTQ